MDGLFAAACAGYTRNNTDRFSHILVFSDDRASMTVLAIREIDPPRIPEIRHHLGIDVDESAGRFDLVRRNIEEFGTIYNTMAAACDIVGVTEARPTKGSS